MAKLTNEQRREMWAEWMRENDETCAVTKQDLRAALDALDDWVDNNSLQVNLAIPQPARGALSSRQKAWLLSAVLRKRFLGGV